jgi:hypothetical protein
MPLIDTRLVKELAHVENEIAACIRLLNDNCARRDRKEALTGKYEARHQALRLRLTELQERKIGIQRSMQREAVYFES